jgi:hypothetical protein
MLQGKRQFQGTLHNPMTDFFTGRSTASGFVLDRRGKVRRTLEIDLEGFWRDEVFCLAEQFTYGEGEREDRTWEVEFLEADRFLARCADLDKPAQGHFEAGEIRMDYVFPVPVGGRKIALRFDDRMYRISPDTLFGRARLSKFGLEVAEIFLVFRKAGTSAN